MGVVRFNQLEDRFNDIADNWLPKVRAASGVAAELLDFRNRETQLLIAANGAEVDDALQRGNQNLTQLRKHDGKQQAPLTGQAVGPYSHPAQGMCCRPRR